MVMGSRDPVDWWDTPLVSEYGRDSRQTDSFTSEHIGDHRSPHHRTR